MRWLVIIWIYLYCVFPIWITKCDGVWFTYTMPCTCRAPTMSLCKRLFKATPQHGKGTAFYMWINNGRFRRSVGNLPSSVSFRQPRGVFRLALRSFPATTRTFTKDTALSKDGMYESARHGTARHGRGMVDARLGMCKTTLKIHKDIYLMSLLRNVWAVHNSKAL